MTQLPLQPEISPSIDGYTNYLARCEQSVKPPVRLQFPFAVNTIISCLFSIELSYSSGVAFPSSSLVSYTQQVTCIYLHLSGASGIT